MPNETAILAKAAALGAALPAFRMVDRPELFSSWADRIAWADSLRHAGKPIADAIAECDRQLGIRRTRLGIGVIPALDGNGLSLSRIVAAIADVVAPQVVAS